MRLVLISDTHGMEVELPNGDVLVHAGDLTMAGSIPEMAKALAWLGRERPRYKRVILIAGNHDFVAESDPVLMGLMCKDHDLTYLSDSGHVFEGVKFWGSPVQPWFCDWAFNRKRGEDIKRHWNLIPDDTDVLITHGPPAGCLGMTDGGDDAGCVDLTVAVTRVEPQVHVFGHIHEAYGMKTKPYIKTKFYNASIMNLAYLPRNRPFVVDL